MTDKTVCFPPYACKWGNNLIFTVQLILYRLTTYAIHYYSCEHVHTFKLHHNISPERVKEVHIIMSLA